MLVSANDVSLRVACDQCGWEKGFYQGVGAGSDYSEETMKMAIEVKGWRWGGDGYHHCPDCLSEKEDRADA